MAAETTPTGMVPPLQLAWQSNVEFARAVAGNNTLYGITAKGNKIVALNASDGNVRWESTGTYVPTHLVLQGNRLMAYMNGQGLAFIDDAGPSAVERLSLNFGAGATVNMSAPLIDGELVYLAVNQGLYATHQRLGLQFGAILSTETPHALGMVSPLELVVINGRGVPTRYHVGRAGFERVWQGEPNGIDAGLSMRPYAIANNWLVVGVGTSTIGYNLTTGRVAWRLENVPCLTFLSAGDIVYGLFLGATVWAIRASDGALLWQRQSMYNDSLTREFNLVQLGDYLYVGGRVATNPDRTMLLALDAYNGSFAWLSRSGTVRWAGGIPATDGFQLFAFGGESTGRYRDLGAPPVISAESISVVPRPLRGPSSDFGPGKVRITLKGSAKVSVAPYREVTGLGKHVVEAVEWGSGIHEVNWNPTIAFSDQKQFSYMLVDVSEPSGAVYTQALVLPVNSFPDILWHWSRDSVEVMVYHKFVSGYADQTFKPNNLVTRAESSAIIAKTLGLERPTAGFHTKFTDIADHWARNFIMALEEQRVVGGFPEPDGTFTFRPELSMTRAQEARILVTAYKVPAAPRGFVSKFTDITSHWAAADIMALESAGYVNGFREAGGTYTYRPQQHLTRAELCAAVVRIRRLTR